MIFFTVPSTIRRNKIVINSFGANNTLKHLKKDQTLKDLETPIRDDGAKFEGWYYSLNFDKQAKSDVCVVEPLVINAKYDKCYCFSLRYNILGCFGKKDEFIKEVDSDNYHIDYFIPKGEYRVTFTDFSKTNKASLFIRSNDNYSKEEGYPIIEKLDYNEKGKYKHITIKENEHISLSEDAVFVFQRTDVDPKYTKFRIE